MRKPQPFTIGTRLSTPKCRDVSSSTVAAASKSRHIGERVSHHLAQSATPSHARGAARSPVSCVTDAESLVRSISKITLSREAEGTAVRGEGTADPLQLLTRTSHENCNNNNSRGLGPDPSDFPYELSGRDLRIFGAAEGHKTAKGDGGEETAPSARILLMGAGRACGEPPDTTQLLQEIQQAESWARCKWQDLTDGGDTCPPALIQRDILAFESEVMKLSQMADHMCRTRPPAAAAVHSRLQALKDQWLLLKEAATNQNCEVGGASDLQEFNKKADELEMWMREQEEPPPLRVLLDQNLDEVQISRKILDLRQEQIHYCRLQESVSMLARKLEKRGRPESKTALARCKHLNRMWLCLQTSLHEHEQSLQLALEAASLWLQVDAILRAVEEKGRCHGQRSRDDGHGDQDLRDIASQIMMLDVTVSQVSKLHPLLSSRALLRHRQVKERWAQLQRTLRTGRTSRYCVTPRDPLTVVTPEQSSVGDGGPAAQTDGGLLSPRSLAAPRSQVSVRHPTDAKRSVTAELQTNHQPQTGHQTQGPPETPEVRHLFRELSHTSQWIQDVEFLLSEPTTMKSPEPIRKDLKKVSLLEREVQTRGSALQSLRGIAKRWVMTKEMEEKVQAVEERCQGLQDALRRRVSDLRDTLVLSEFMKIVQMEEERKKKETMSSRGAPWGDPDVPPVDRTEIFSPLEELQEAVDMLNDAVKERARALAATGEAEALESRVSAVSHMMEAACTKLCDVQSQLEAAEKEFMTARTETELTDLRGSISQQQRTETDISGAIKMEVKAVEEQREALQGLCPARGLSVSRSIEDALTTWTDLQTLVHENRTRLQRMTLMREFILRYLSLRSRAVVFRGPVLSGGAGGLSAAQREELERMMRGKRKEFEVLAGIGWKLIGEDHRLLQMVQERLEEVQGLLIRWRCWKQQRIVGNQMPQVKIKETTDNIEAEKDIGPRALEEFECGQDEDTAPCLAPRGPKLRRYRRRALSPILFQPPSSRPPAGTDLEDGVQTVEEGPRKCTKGPLWLEPKNLPTGSTSPKPSEEVITVSTYLNTKEETKTMYQSLTVPRVSKIVCSSASNSSFPTFEPSGGLPKIRSNALFMSLLRKEKAHRCTIQGIMGLCSDPKPNTKDIPKYQISTWPPKQENYVKNPLSKDIDPVCGSGSKKLPPNSLHSCPHLTIGRNLTLQISKEPHMLTNIQDPITVISVDDSCNTQNLYSEEKPEPSAHELKEKEDTEWSGTRAWLDAITSSSGYCRQNILGYGRTTASAQNSRDLEDFIDNFEIGRLSPSVLRHLDWDSQEENMNSPRIVGAYSSNCKVSDSPCYSGGATTLSSTVLQEMGGTSSISSSIFHKTRGTFTTSSPVLLETRGTFTTSSPVLQETGGTFTTSTPIFHETGGTFTTSSPVLLETGGTSTTSSPVFQEMGGTSTISSPVLQEMGGTSTTSSRVLQEMGGTSTTSSSVPYEISGTFTTVSLILQETADTFTTCSSVLYETGGTFSTSSPVLHETGRTFSTSSPVLQETTGTSFFFWRNVDEVVDQYCMKKHYGDGQRASNCSCNCVLHIHETHCKRSDPYNLRETPPDKGIFTKTSILPEVLHPDHEFLENDDEELEGIWSNAKKVPVMCQVQASHHIAAKGMVEGGLSPEEHDSHREPYGHVLTGTEPNLLMATFTLPSSTRRSTQLATDKRPNTWRGKSESIICTPANWYPEDMSKSRRSAQTPLLETAENKPMGEKVTQKLEFYLMEGPLERKPVLQVGGRKASSRTWGTFYAVLVRRTLCVYYDQKYSTKSSASASPLHLTGAICTPESDYTKRENCFRLRLMDGSEYLFRAPTPVSLHQWVKKLRHNSRMEASDLLRDAVPASEMPSRIMSGSLMPDLYQPIPSQATDLAQVAKPPYWKTTNVTAAQTVITSSSQESSLQKISYLEHIPQFFPNLYTTPDEESDCVALHSNRTSPPPHSGIMLPIGV